MKMQKEYQTKLLTIKGAERRLNLALNMAKEFGESIIRLNEDLYLIKKVKINDEQERIAGDDDINIGINIDIVSPSMGDDSNSSIKY